MGVWSDTYAPEKKPARIASAMSDAGVVNAIQDQ